MSLLYDHFKLKSKLKHVGKEKEEKGTWRIPLFSFITKNATGLQIFGHNEIETTLYYQNRVLTD